MSIMNEIFLNGLVYHPYIIDKIREKEKKYEGVSRHWLHVTNKFIPLLSYHVLVPGQITAEKKQQKNKQNNIPHFCTEGSKC